ncbi:MAG: response regulator [Alphaproteobacteria bacterium]
MATKRTEKLQILLDDAELEAIDEWRFEHYMPSRSAAVRALLHVALQARGPKSKRPATVANSREVGVVDSSPEMRAALGTGARKKVLLVEDEYLIAAGLESIVDGLGYQVLGPVSETGQALDMLEQVTPDAVVLDIDLGTETSLGLAEIIMQREIPIVFCTGVALAMPEALKSVPLVSKPHVREEIARVLGILTQTEREVA